MSSSTLHILAMLFMLVDHIGAILFPQYVVLRCIGRLAYPIYAFMIVQGVKHTKNIKNYVLRMFFFALIAEIPFDLMLRNTIYNPLSQNVLWTFVISIICICILEYFKDEDVYYYLALPLVCFLGYMVANVLKTDYKGAGVLMVLIFYVFDDHTFIGAFMQFALLYIVNGRLMKSFLIPLLGTWMPIQTLAVLSLLLVWLYNGKKGIKSRVFQYFCYAFYPLHMVLLWLI